MAKANHLHKYKKVNISRDKKPFIVFKCVLPVCSHYIAFKLAEGKLCACNRCGEMMLLTKASMQLTKPHCSSCVKRKKPNVEVIAEYLSGTKI